MKLCLLGALALGAGACGETSSTLNLAGPSPVKCQVSVAGADSAFGHGGGRGTARVDAARECLWSAASESPWIALETRSGQGSGPVAYVVAPNPAPVSRTGAFRVDDQPVTVSQEPAPCRIQLTPARTELGPDVANGEIHVAVLSGCGWEARSSAAWLTIAAGGSGNGNGVVHFGVAANGGASRDARITVGDQAAIVTQEARRVSPSPDPPKPDPAPTPDPPQPGPGPAPDPNPTPEPDPAPPAPSPPPSGPPQKVELEGWATNITGSCPNLTFEVRGTTVVTNSDTRFRDGPCRRLQNSNKAIEVEVKGYRQPDGSVLAQEVELD